MFPSDWAPPCGKCCTKKYSSILQIPWRVFCKKGCGTDAENWEECTEQCEGICYKDPVLKDQQWSAYIDRSPGDESYSMECFRACVSGCGFKFEVAPEKADEVQPKRPPKPPVVKKPPAPPHAPPADDMPSTSA